MMIYFWACDIPITIGMRSVSTTSVSRRDDIYLISRRYHPTHVYAHLLRVDHHLDNPIPEPAAGRVAGRPDLKCSCRSTSVRPPKLFTWSPPVFGALAVCGLGMSMSQANRKSHNL
jgi:hypothetical protein